jgi:hypothetical protein
MHMDDDHHADELLRRALIEPEDSAAVALRVSGLPLSQTLTVVFHGRRDLGTIQTYVAPGGHGAGSAVAADALLRVPCDLDLAEAEDRESAEQLYAEQAATLRDALVGRRHRARHLARAARGPGRRAGDARPLRLDQRAPSRSPAHAVGARGLGPADRRDARVQRPAA